jgi:hypothetical protein
VPGQTLDQGGYSQERINLGSSGCRSPASCSGLEQARLSQGQVRTLGSAARGSLWPPAGLRVASHDRTDSRRPGCGVQNAQSLDWSARSSCRVTREASSRCGRDRPSSRARAPWPSHVGDGGESQVQGLPRPSSPRAADPRRVLAGLREGEQPDSVHLGAPENLRSQIGPPPTSDRVARYRSRTRKAATACSCGVARGGREPRRRTPRARGPLRGAAGSWAAATDQSRMPFARSVVSR